LQNAYIRWLGRKKTDAIQDPGVCCLGCPKEYGAIFQTLKQMDFFSVPNYDAFIGPLRQIMARKGFAEQAPLDWEPKGEFAQATMMVPNANMLHNENRKRSM